MSTPLAEYLSALQARDAREKAHEKYIQAYTQLADRTASTEQPQPQPPDELSDPRTNASIRTIRASTPKGKEKTTSPLPEPTASSNITQIRRELASSHKIRGEQETQIASLTTENASMKATNTEQNRRIAQLENANKSLERKVKDRAEELKGKGQFVEQVQDELLALQLQLNMMERENEKLKQDNEELTRRWVAAKEEEAKIMNDRMGWDDKKRRK